MNFKVACRTINVRECTARFSGAREKFFKKAGKEVVCIDFKAFKEFMLDYRAREAEHRAKKGFWNEQEIECINAHKLGGCKYCSANFIKDCQMAKHIISKIDKGV